MIKDLLIVSEVELNKLKTLNYYPSISLTFVLDAQTNLIIEIKRDCSFEYPQGHNIYFG